MWLILLLTALGLFYFFAKKRYSYWKERGVPGPEPTLIFGNLGPNLMGKKGITEVYTEIYRKYEGYPFVGIYRMLTPCLLVREPEMIKCLAIKDFKHFQNNDLEVDKEIDKIFGRNPFVLKGSEWKNKRAQITSCFSSKKMKAMFPLLEEGSNKMLKFIEESCKSDRVLLEAQDLCVRYTLTNVASCAFGFEARCFEEDRPMFRQIGDAFLSPSGWSAVKGFITFFLPSISKILKVKLVSADVENKLIEIVREITDQRKKNNIVKNDFLDSVSEIFQTSDRTEDELNIVGQCSTFFLDGYETSSRVMSILLFELANNPECQRKLREEINTYCEESGKILNYESLQELPYLDACVNESLRKNQILGQLVKRCNEKYTYTCTDPEYKNLTVTIEPGTTIIFPSAGIHNDEKFYDSPENYMPERFLEKNDINKEVFFPFGQGPRTCLGMRFGLAQVRLGVAHLVKNFEMTVNKKTQLPLKFDKWYLLLAPVGGLWLDFKRIGQE